MLATFKDQNNNSFDKSKVLVENSIAKELSDMRNDALLRIAKPMHMAKNGEDMLQEMRSINLEFEFKTECSDAIFKYAGLQVRYLEMAGVCKRTHGMVRDAPWW